MCDLITNVEQCIMSECAELTCGDHVTTKIIKASRVRAWHQKAALRQTRVIDSSNPGIRKRLRKRYFLPARK